MSYRSRARLRQNRKQASIEILESRTLLAQIAGHVFFDPNGNGVQDPGENGVAFQTQTIFLDQNDNGVVDPGEKSTSVDPFGDYAFSGLAAGTYRVRLEQDPGYLRTSPATDSKQITVTASQNAAGPVFGLTQRAMIDGFTYNDANHNGKQDPSEPLLPNSIVYLDQNNNGKIDSTTTSFSSTNVPKSAVGFSTVASNLTVNGLTGVITDVNVTVNISSPNANDPQVYLEDPQGIRVLLVTPSDTANQDTRSNFTNTVFDDQASKPISEGVAPFIGSFRTSGFAEGAGLDQFNLISGNGTWRLILQDTATPNTAKLNSWSLKITSGDPQSKTVGSNAYIFQPWPGSYTVRAQHTGFVVTQPSAANGQKYSFKLNSTDFKQDQNFGLREVTTTKQTVTFAPAVTLTHLTEDSPFGIVQGDFNKDGKLDIATVNNGSNDVSIYLGKGNGTFNNPVFYPVGLAPRGIAMGDLNKDGIMDLVVSNHDPHNISVLIGKANGTFKPQVTYPIGTLPWSVALADFNKDGNLDVVVGDNGSKNVSILLGNGNGTFKTASPIHVAAALDPMAVKAVDINNDGKMDIITANSNSKNISVLLGNGNGTFKPAINTPVGNDPEALNVVDLNGDGKKDLIVANAGDNDITVLLGKGNGTFSPGVIYSTGNTPASIALGDVNKDGKTDVIVSDRGDGTPGNAGDVRVFLSNGDGTLQPPFILTAHTSPVAVATGDFNRDGKLDLAVANFFSDDVSILTNTTAPFTPAG